MVNIREEIEVAKLNDSQNKNHSVEDVLITRLQEALDKIEKLQSPESILFMLRSHVTLCCEPCGNRWGDFVKVSLMWDKVEISSDTFNK